MNDIYELADELATEIEESGKTKWSAKDVKDFFLSEGIDLSLDEILQVWNACPSPVCACELMGCNQSIEASDNFPTISSFSFDFIVMYNYSEDIWNIVERIVTDIFEANGCDVIGFELREVDYSDSPEYAEFEPIQAGITFKWYVDYDYNKIIRSIERSMQDNGYQVIGNPEFDSIDE